MLHFHIISGLESQSYLNIILNGTPRADPKVRIGCTDYVGPHLGDTMAHSPTTKGSNLLLPG
jgi:hypothetical protein